MALDALAIHCLTKELSAAAVGNRIDKIHQPERDEIVLHLRGFTGAHKLVLSASPSHPRVHFTKETKENPKTPPMFCMLLRKHLSGGKITAVRQIDFERILAFDIESYDELGDLTTKHLIAELMGRHSNLILTDHQERIIDCIKHVDLTISSVRQVLPGMTYTAPPPQNKIELSCLQPGQFHLSPLPGVRPDKLLMNTISGISPLTAREIVYNAFGRMDGQTDRLTESEREQLERSAVQYAENLRAEKFRPCLITDNSGKILDFSAIEIRQYEGLATVTYFDQLSDVLFAFYNGRDKTARMKQKSADLVKLLNNHLERAAKKLAIQKKTIADAEKKEQYKIYGDLLTANLYRIKEDTRSIDLENYYEPDCPIVHISLNPQFSPAQNAQRYYKRYTKAKTAEIEVAKQIKSNLADIEYLESTLAAVETAATEADLNAIRTELAEQGYLKRKTIVKKKQQQSVSKPMHYVSSDGFDIYVGKNNTQNDYLTLRFANSSDLWFHTKNIHGSHTVIKLGLDKEVPKQTILEAAQLAAYYSKGRDSSQVPVDYTQIKNVKKPNGAKPGMVIYDSYNTIYVTPKLLEQPQ